ncbi:YqhR family membrane protein [Thalassorhabdus alkalitolerans]|uniref:YqhR family membrane protein n=1 Tax=Thalassorhabdus alkalitolerans TaxID=2282697 RepID=A0ABW0YPN3_9BACI|nr:YqhR family membrane protein [Thalassobacillus sp. C254]
MANAQKTRNNDTDESLSYMSKVALIGICGGIIWSIIGYIAFFLNFSRVGPALVLMPWALGDWKNGYLGQWIGILVIGLLSILSAYLYKVIFQKWDSLIPGMIYGFVLWLLVFYILNPLFPGLKPLPLLDFNTIATNICLYILYGVFIGYSISYEYTTMKESS